MGELNSNLKLGTETPLFFKMDKNRLKERVAEALEGKTRIQILFKEYSEVENELFAELERLPRCGNECNCDEPEPFKYVNEGHFDEIMVVCLNCGGMLEKDT